MKKNIILIFFSTIISIFIIYFFSIIYTYFNLNELSPYLFKSKSNLIFHKKYSKVIHHLRDISSHPKYYLNSAREEENLLFTFIGDDKKEISILLQGDSWIEQSLTDKKKYNLFYDSIKNYSSNNNVRFINAGISSFSPTPMKLQFELLEKDFKIKPSIVVAYIDQTDIGDENCRYKKNRIYDKGKLIGIKEESFSGKPFDYTKNYQESEIFLKKNSKIKTSYELLNFRIYYTIKKTIIKNTNKINRILKHGWKNRKLSKCYWSDIQRYLITSSNEELNYFKDSINFYLNYLEKKNYIKKIILVTFPHQNHLQKQLYNEENIYNYNVSNLVDELVLNRKKIYHLNFSKLIFDNSIEIIEENYKKNDPASHLNPNFYSSIFMKTILEKTIKFVK